MDRKAEKKYELSPTGGGVGTQTFKVVRLLEKNTTFLFVSSNIDSGCSTPPPLWSKN